MRTGQTRTWDAGNGRGLIIRIARICRWLLTPQSRIRDGDLLKVSYYYAPVLDAGQVGICLSHPETYKILADGFHGISELLGPSKILISCDEVRVIGQCQLCRSRNQNCGQILADAVKKCQAIIKHEIPEAQMFVWSDMFDPYHNAVANYYLTASTLEGSWEGIGAECGIFNWNFGKSSESLAFFNKRGHRQISHGIMMSRRGKKA